jgi:DNA-binding response OmpR family regulator
MARILVIEEDIDYSALLASELTSWGHEVESAPNGRTAFPRLVDSKFDLILTAIAMPVMDAVEFINWSPYASRPPILAMSDYSSEQAICLLKVAMLLGADASLRKPFTREELHDVVGSLLGREDETVPELLDA